MDKAQSIKNAVDLVWCSRIFMQYANVGLVFSRYGVLKSDGEMCVGSGDFVQMEKIL